jgi:hypothetical protein
VILLSGTTAHAHTTYHFSATRQRNAAGEHHHAPVVGHLDSKELPARLETRLPPSSTTAVSFRSVASMTLRAFSGVTMDILATEERCNCHSKIGLHVAR